MAKSYPREEGYGDETPPPSMMRQKRQPKRKQDKETKRKTKR